jgi:hypothetical protein
MKVLEAREKEHTGTITELVKLAQDLKNKLEKQAEVSKRMNAEFQVLLFN